MIERGYFVRALRIVWRDPVSYIIGGFILHAIVALAFGLLIGPAICGIVWVTLKHLRGEEVLFADLFRGFDNFSNTLIAGLVVCGMIAGGLVLGVIPGIVAGALFCFVFPIIVDTQIPLPQALEASRRLAGAEDLLDKAIFFLIALLVGLSGIVLFMGGVIFTWSLMWAVVAVAYEDMRTTRAPA